ncbi:MAG: hypothetical protein HPM95_20840 [Alphaproteobacteria bacterium]|nr:hypothetical protein [Alphaproteobacteria bacterium]
MTDDECTALAGEYVLGIAFPPRTGAGWSVARRRRPSRPRNRGLGDPSGALSQTLEEVPAPDGLLPLIEAELIARR